MRLITFVISHSMRRLFGIGFSRLFGIGRRGIDAAKVELGSDPSNTCIRFCSRHLQVLPIHACSQKGWMHFWFDCLRLFFNACIKQKTNKTQNFNVGIAASIYPQLLTKKQHLSSYPLSFQIREMLNTRVLSRSRSRRQVERRPNACSGT
jgi:hypothetical protein